VAWALLERGQIDEADRMAAESEATWPEPEPQALPYVWTFKGRLEAAKGRPDQALDCFLTGITDLGSHTEVGHSELLLFEAIRGLLGAGRVPEARNLLRELRRVVNDRVHAEAYAEWAAALLEDRPQPRLEALRRVQGVFERLGRPIDQARCLMDVARAERDLGLPPTPSVERARDLFVDCGAVVRAREAASLLEELSSV
jgi:tetratricopeptide (TPR) repeat protein